MAISTSVVVRAPQRPHAEAVSFRPIDTKYGFGLMRANTASFSIDRNDRLFPELADLLFVGTALSIERSDDLYPWAGFISRREANIGGSEVLFEVKDHAGVLLERAHSRADWGEHSRSSAQHIQTIFGDADRRNVPPLMLDFDLAPGGPAINYEPRALSLLDVLRDMSDAADWEWEVVSNPTRGDTRTKLRWRERLGRDMSSELILEQGRHFKEAKYTQVLSSFFGQVEAIGGTGPVPDRPIEAVTPTEPRFLANKAAALGGSVVRFEPNVTNPEALTTAARKMLDSPDFVAESLSFSLIESELDSDYPLHIGDSVKVRFSDIDLGLGLVRVVRILGIQLTAGSGVLDVECKVVE